MKQTIRVCSVASSAERCTGQMWSSVFQRDVCIISVLYSDPMIFQASVAIKRLTANNRLILSGTPIQNNVLELWSLFDFLMPGFLGTEKQFTARYSKPILASRDPKSSQREQEAGMDIINLLYLLWIPFKWPIHVTTVQTKRTLQFHWSFKHQLSLNRYNVQNSTLLRLCVIPVMYAGVLAMEALHRQVLPFVLRRTKEDVLKDLPPKITQVSPKSRFSVNYWHVLISS